MVEGRLKSTLEGRRRQGPQSALLSPRRFPSNLTERRGEESAGLGAELACRGNTALAANR